MQDVVQHAVATIGPREPPEPLAGRALSIISESLERRRREGGRVGVGLRGFPDLKRDNQCFALLRRQHEVEIRDRLCRGLWRHDRAHGEADVQDAKDSIGA